MALSLKHPEADRLARELSSETGEGLTEAVIVALRERLERVRRRRPYRLADEIMRIGRECAALPELDTRTAEEIIGFDSAGMPS
jgi:antitoxin VapB